MSESLIAAGAELAERATALAEATRSLLAAPGLDLVRQAREVDRLAERVLQLSVSAVRQSGSTWQDIGDILGVSRQAAFQRFGKPIDPRTGQPMDKTTLPGAGERAVTVVVDAIAGRFELFRDQLDTTMRAGLTDAALGEANAKIAGLVGVFESVSGEPFVRRIADHTVVDVPLEYEAGTMKGRIAFNADGTIAGLFILNPEVP
ncbi:DUF3887 domain-containing protein [Nocardia sp. R16R-3T]